MGKGTVVAELVRQYPDELWLSRSWTTREQRPGEADDAYVFVTPSEFQNHIDAGGFIEYAEFLGNLYGTPLPDAPDGMDLIYEIDVQGARQVRAVDPAAVLVFLHAPSAEEQEARLRHRGDPEDKVQQRLAKAREEADAGTELGAIPVVNHEIDRTEAELYDIIRSARANR